MPRLCAIPNCRRAVKPGKPVCGQHVRTPEGRRLIDEVRALAHLLADDEELALPPPLTRKPVRRTLRRKLERGDLHALFQSPIAELADRNATESEILSGIAVNRVAITRLLTEPTDAVAMSNGVVRHVNSNVDLLKLKLRNRKPPP